MTQQDKLSRGKFLSVAGASTLAAGTKITCDGQISESSKSISIAGEYDVIVGRGTSGLHAAVAAARKGSKDGPIENGKE